MKLIIVGSILLLIMWGGACAIVWIGAKRNKAHDEAFKKYVAENET